MKMIWQKSEDVSGTCVGRSFTEQTEKEEGLMVLAERVCVCVCVYFVMTRLGEPVDLTVQNGENLFPSILSRSPNPAGLDGGCVCLLCLSSNPQPRLP